MKGWENLPETAYQRTQWLRDEQRATLLGVASKSKSLPLTTVILVALYTGYRKEVIQTLTWASIDFELNVINVPQKYNLEGKQGKPRAYNLPIVPELREILLEHRQLMKSACVQSTFLFPSPTNAQMPWDFSRPFETAVKNAGLTDFHFHDLLILCRVRKNLVQQQNYLRLRIFHCSDRNHNRSIHLRQYRLS